MINNCIRCGNLIEEIKKYANVKYCRSCAFVVTREKTKEYNAKRRANYVPRNVFYSNPENMAKLKELKDGKMQKDN